MTRNIHRAIEQVETQMSRALDASSAKPPKKEISKKSPIIRAWRAPADNHFQYPEPKARSIFQEKSVTKLAVIARAVKVTIPLDPAAVGALPPPNQERVELAVSCDGQLYTASISTKSLRKAKNIIAADGADSVFVMLQGKLRGHEILECGLVAQIKTTQGVTK